MHGKLCWRETYVAYVATLRTLRLKDTECESDEIVNKLCSMSFALECIGP
jgi:hypothetical protein